MAEKPFSELYQVREFGNLKDMLNQSTELFGNKAAFYVRNESKDYTGITYSTFKNDIDALGTALLSLGLKDRHVALMGENRYEWCTSYLSVVNGTGVVVPIDKELPVDDVMDILNVSGAGAFIFSGKFRKYKDKMTGRLPEGIFLIDMDAGEESDGILSFSELMNKGRELLKNGDRSFIDAVIDTEKMSILLFTSGTTGMSKGVMLSQRNICSNIKAIRKTVYVDEKDKALSILPLHHTYECTIGFLTLIYSGSSIAFSDGLKHVAKNMTEVGPTVLVTVPLLLENVHSKILKNAAQMKFGMTKLRFGVILSGILGFLGINVRKKIFKAIHDKLGSNMRLIITGAAGIDPGVSRDFRRFGFKVLQGYGLTECSPLAIGNNDKFYKDSAVGLPIPGTEIKIADQDDNGVGEILIKGPNVMMGYYKNDEATKAVMEDGWFHSGDLGKVDKKGFYTITGRIKNVIVTKNGKNIYPEEVEFFLNNSPYIQECLVWGEQDDSTDETFVKAQIFPDFEAIKEKLKMQNVSNEDVNSVISGEVKQVNSRLPLYKHIRGFSIRDNEFIKTTTKKIKRYLEGNQNSQKNSNKM